jgi:bifunctional ADP-heptose synthase (sugar kinase/adenylyltransferase)
MVCCADSRRRLESFRGVTVAVPNESEVFPGRESRARSARDRLVELAPQLLEALTLEALLVTRGSAGMMIFERRSAPVEVGVVGGVEVVDVTGAGDTVAAAVTLGLAAGGSIVEAAILASHAAGVVVMKRGTAAAAASEVLASLEERWGGA